MFSAVRSQHSGIDICINNAGLARPDTLLSGSTSGWKDMFNVRAAGLDGGLGRRVGSQGSVNQGAAWGRTAKQRVLWVPTWGTLTLPLFLSLPKAQ